MRTRFRVYLRFVIDGVHANTGRRAGLFDAAYRLQEGATLSAGDQQELDTLLAWFADHLPAPDRFGRARHPHGISWIRADARAHVERLHALGGLMRRHGYQVEMLRTKRPGYIVYEDEAQAIAEPFADTLPEP